MTMTPIEDVIAAAEAQAVIDWEREREAERKAALPCTHESYQERQYHCSPVVTRVCTDCGKVLP